MAITPLFPLRFFTSPPLFSLFQPQSPNTFITLSSPNTNTNTNTQVDTKPQKKKRKLRPSFYEQIRHKWSLKTVSNRKKFPWEEKNVKEDLEDVEEEVEVEVEGEGLQGEPGSFSLGSHVINAPWSVRTESWDSSEAEKVKSNENVGISSEPNYYYDTQIGQKVNARSSITQFSNEAEKAKTSEDFKYEAEKAKNSKTFSIRNGQHFDYEVEGVSIRSKLQFEYVDEIAEKDEGRSELHVCKEVETETAQKSNARSKDQFYEDGETGGSDVFDGIVIESHLDCEAQVAQSNDTLSTKSEPYFDYGAEVDCSTERLGFRRKSYSNVSIRSKAHFENEAEIVTKNENIGFVSERQFGYEAGVSQGNNEDDVLADVPEELRRDFRSTKEEVVKRSVKVAERLPWEKEKRGDGDKWKRSNTALAEKMIPEMELRRLRNVALRMKERIKVGSAGVTQALVDVIAGKWEVNEVVKLKFEGLSTLNMKRTHDVLESKIGGLVIWRSGSSIVLFRGMGYNFHCVQSYTKTSETNMNVDIRESVVGNAGGADLDNARLSSGTGYLKTSSRLSEKEMRDIDVLNSLLDELGPRFVDWSGCDPIPVDADMLPSILPSYKPPFRLLPSGVRPVLGNKQMTTFRRDARTMPPHFALGRNRELQGLAMAIVKLWKKSAVVKIAIKRGVLNTSNERMAEEIKRLTGGTLVSRNKDYIVFYRGNDFLSSAITDVLADRQKLAELQHVEEENARQRATSALIDSNAKSTKVPLVAGTLAETMAANSRWGNQPTREDIEKMRRDFSLAKHVSLIRYLEKKLTHAQEKVGKAEKALRKVQNNLIVKDLPTDIETISAEERFLFRKMGLSMKPFLHIGRRGIFDGTVENMHLHWKHRELVKLIVKGKSYPLVKHIAISLEAESGGLLISVDKTMKGYEIIIYRGKNYQRPQAIKPDNLLTRRQALARSIELQRREALNHHILDLLERIELVKSELEHVKAIKETGNDKLYTRLNGAYLSEDDFEDDDEDLYLKLYINNDDYDKEEDTQVKKFAWKRNTRSAIES